MVCGGEFEVDIREVAGQGNGFFPCAVTGMTEQEPDVGISFGNLAHILGAATAIESPGVREDHEPAGLGSLPHGDVPWVVNGVPVHGWVDLDADYAGLAEMGIEFFFDVLREAGIRGAVAVDSTGVFGNGVAHLDVTLAGISVECAVR